MEKELLEWLCAANRERRAALDKFGERLDRSLLTLSGGALLLSMTFIKDIAPHPIAKAFLFAAWVGFGASILFVLLSIFFGQLSLVWSVREVEDLMQKLARNPEPSNDLFAISPTHEREKTFWTRLGTFASWLSMIGFLVGIILIGIFIGKNI